MQILRARHASFLKGAREASHRSVALALFGVDSALHIIMFSSIIVCNSISNCFSSIVILG